MKEKRIPDTEIDPVCKRLERLVEVRKTANEEALGRIKFLTDSWGPLNKTLEVDIKDEFELMDLENQALDEALGDLEENRTRPVEGAFTIAGKVLSEREKIGLPNVNVLVLQRIGKKSKLMVKGITDNLGNFVFRLGDETFDGNDRSELEVEYQVFAGDGTLLHSEVQPLTRRLGGIGRVMLAVAETDVVSDQLEAGKAVRDSILDSRNLIASRVENMRGAHDALAKMTGIVRDELDALHEALTVPPPEIIEVITPPSPEDDQPEPEPDTPEEPVPSTDEPSDKGEKEDTEPERPKRELLKLEEITGIGPSRAKILKKAKIKDIPTFIDTDNKTLTELLGRLDFKAMKKEARALLKKK
jgi:hypothetical protein